MTHTDNARDDGVEQAYRSGLPLRDICARYAVGATTVERILLLRGVPRRRNGSLGARSRLHYAEVMRLRAEGLSYGEIAKRLGVSRQRVHQVVAYGTGRPEGECL